MENQKNKINVFESQRPELSREKKDDLWSAIENDIKNSPVPSPFLFNFINQKRMITAFAALVLMFGVGGTVYASNEARPGDLLFPIDQAIEEIRLAVVGNDDDRARLQIQFAEERLAELRSILEEDDFSNSDANSDDSYSTSTISNFEAEADVFLDTTIVKVEINDRKTTFETNAKTKEEIVNEIVSKFSLERTLVEQVLGMEVEDRVSRMEDDRDEDLEDDRDDDSNEDDSDDSENDEEDDSDFDNESEDGDIKIEVRVEDGKAEVKMEYDNKEDEFNFSYSDRDGLISELARRSSLSKTIIEENLDLEIRD
jgi:hypothetical protein